MCLTARCRRAAVSISRVAMVRAPSRGKSVGTGVLCFPLRPGDDEEEADARGSDLARIAHRVFGLRPSVKAGGLLKRVGRHVADSGRRNFLEGILALFSAGFYVPFARAAVKGPAVVGKVT